MKIIYLNILVYFVIQDVSAQIFSNLLLQYNESSHFRNILSEDTLSHYSLTGTDKFEESELGLDISGSLKNSAVDHYSVYNDRSHYLISPYLKYKYSDQITFCVRVNAENKKNQLLYESRSFWSEDFAGHRGGFEQAKIEYQTKNLFVKFGRDYFLQGKYFYENLLYSKFNYPYDQILIGFKNKYFELSTYYINLNSIQTNTGLNERHLNGHRFSLNYNFGYIAVNDVILYGGPNRNVNLTLFNPLLLYYPYQKNFKNFESNSIMSVELYLFYADYFLFLEVLIDDFQVDNEQPSDLEPTEWGVNISTGKTSIFGDFDFKMNYTMIANRTFNAPEKQYEKYIYKNYPIGHFLGNNFWEFKTSLIYKYGKSLFGDLSLYYFEYGDEALYGAFNKDYLGFSVDEGYNENFPFGTIRNQLGTVINLTYKYSSNLLVNGRISHWIGNEVLNNDINYSLSVAYRLSRIF